jgi:hypothetical protein
MAYSKAKLKRNGVKASPSFRLFWVGKLSDRFYLYIIYYRFYLNILISLASFMGTLYCIRTLCNTSLLTES